MNGYTASAKAVIAFWPANAVGELIFNPLPVRPATVENPKKTAQKNDAPPQIIVR